MGVALTMERKAGVSAVKPTPVMAVRKAAESLSRRNADTAVCELLNEALGRLVDLAFEEDEGGLCNVDSVTGRLLLPLPWGRNGHRLWGLRPQEANVLRRLLFDWRKDGSLPLLTYDRLRRAWYVNLADYADRRVAGRWLAEHQVTVSQYRIARAKVLGHA